MPDFNYRVYGEQEDIYSFYILINGLCKHMIKHQIGII